MIKWIAKLKNKSGKKSNKEIYAEILQWAKGNQPFDMKELHNAFPNYIKLIDQAQNKEELFLYFREQGTDSSGQPTYKHKYLLSFEGAFKLLEYTELQEARQSSKIAQWSSFIAILISIIAIAIDIFMRTGSS
jgi:hypothetical protein